MLDGRFLPARRQANSVSCFAQTLDATPDLDPPDEGSLPVDVRLVIEEAKVGCLMAMLLCLDREHRMAFVLGDIFEATDAVAAEVLGISVIPQSATDNRDPCHPCLRLHAAAGLRR